MATTRTCDTCGRRLDNSGPYPSFRTRLETESMPNLSDYEYGVMVHPSLPVGAFDFCDRVCLMKWLESEAGSGEGEAR